MPELVARDLMLAWEWGKDRHPIDRALVLLAVAHPGHDRERLARLSIGQRDALLLALRERLFGPLLEVQVQCPSCEEAYQFDVTVEDVTLRAPTLEPDDQEYSESYAGEMVRFRLPNSEDLIAVAGLADPGEARRALLSRCVTAGPRPPDDALAARLSAAILAHDPQTEVAFPFQCDICEQRWNAELDIVSYLWAEVSSWCNRTMHDVVLLSKALSWSEAEILSMSDERRLAYVKLCAR